MSKASAPLPDYATIKKQYEAAKEIKRKEDEAKEATASQSTTTSSSRKRDNVLSKNVGLVMIWFTIIAILHILGLYLFTNGFLLTRLVLSDESKCEELPIPSPYKSSVSNGCWHPKTFDKVVLIIIDALRYDFTVPFQSTHPEDTPKNFHNAFPVLYELSEKSHSNALLLPFIADPPTTTLQRLKGLTTGTLPTFIDAGSNFGGTSIDEDNLITQAVSAGKRVVHIGDDTWHALFPGHFDTNLTRPYDSFNVWDLHTVDNGVIEHLDPLLSKANSTKWDILIGHMLGVDHAGHRYGPDHPAMASKLAQMDKFIRSIIPKIDDNTLLVVMGDHGMDAKGDHGGESDEEIQAALWMYSKKSIFGRRPGQSHTPLLATDRPVPQIDLVPTLALLLGLPVPFNNLGAPIYEAFSGPSGTNYRNLASVYRLVAAQVSRYMKRYAEARNTDISSTITKWDFAEHLSRDAKKSSSFKEISEAYQSYQNEVLSLCKSLWARFDVPSMIAGIVILAAGLILLLLYVGYKSDVIALSIPLGINTALSGSIGLGLSFSLAVVTETISLPLSAFTTAVGILIGVASVFINLNGALSIPLPTSWPSFITVLFTVALSAGFAANSFTIWEDRIVLFFLTTISIGLLIASLREKKHADKVLGSYYSIGFMVLSRVASFSKLCREEQMPYCTSTYYASSTSSTSAAWHLIVPVAVALALPGIVKQFYQETQSYHHSAVLWYCITFRLVLWCSATYWFLNTADDNDWFGFSSISWLQDIKLMIAQTSLGMALAVGYSIYAWSAPFLATSKGLSNGVGERSEAPNNIPLPLLGRGNPHGTRYFPLLTVWAAATVQLSKPLGGGAIAILLVQILCLLEVLSTTSLQNTPIAPLTLFLLGQLHFFATGHQAVLSSIQWDAAFIALRSIRQPWSAFAMALNTLGPQILVTLAVPAFALWRVSGREKGLLSKIAKSYAQYVAIHGLMLLATSVWAMWLRRHLMLFRVFCPRWLLAGVTLLVVDAMVVLGGLVGAWISVGSVREVFV
jgi:phosphatidylinositol glycan class O